jgi:nucleotide-binding universal stress UspA family protein
MSDTGGDDAGGSADPTAEGSAGSDGLPPDLAIREPPVVLVPVAVRAQAAVDDIAASFVDAGGDPETRVVFTHDREQTLERVATELGATALLLPNPVGKVSEVLVPIRGAIDDDRLADLVATLADEAHERVTLWGLTDGPGGFDADAAVADTADRLRARGVTEAQIATETATTEAPIRDIVKRSADADVVVMGEGDESILDALFGDDAERVAEGAVAPVLVVRNRDPDEERIEGGDEE